MSVLIRAMLVLALACSIFATSCCCVGGSDSDNNGDTALNNPQNP